MHRLSAVLLAMGWRNNTFKKHTRKAVYEFSSDSSSTWHTSTAISLRKKKQIAAKLLAELFTHMMTGFLQVIFIIFHWKWVSYEAGWNLSPLHFFYLLAIMEMRTIVKTMTPAIPPIHIPRMFPWTCLDWHLSPVKKKACPDGHLGKQSTHSVGLVRSLVMFSPHRPHICCPRWAVPIGGVHVTTFPLC